MGFDLANDLMDGLEGLNTSNMYDFSIIELIICKILLASLIFADLSYPAYWKMLSDPKEELLEFGWFLLRFLVLGSEQLL